MKPSRERTTYYPPRVYLAGTAPANLTPSTCGNPIHKLTDAQWRAAGEPECRDCEPEEVS